MDCSVSLILDNYMGAEKYSASKWKNEKALIRKQTMTLIQISESMHKEIEWNQASWAKFILPTAEALFIFTFPFLFWLLNTYIKGGSITNFRSRRKLCGWSYYREWSAWRCSHEEHCIVCKGNYLLYTSIIFREIILNFFFFLIIRLS